MPWLALRRTTLPVIVIRPGRSASLWKLMRLLAALSTVLPVTIAVGHSTLMPLPDDLFSHALGDALGQSTIDTTVIRFRPLWESGRHVAQVLPLSERSQPDIPANAGKGAKEGCVAGTSGPDAPPPARRRHDTVHGLIGPRRDRDSVAAVGVHGREDAGLHRLVDGPLRRSRRDTPRSPTQGTVIAGWAMSCGRIRHTTEFRRGRRASTDDNGRRLA